MELADYQAKLLGQINVIALASDFSVLDQDILPNDQVPQTQLSVQASGMNMVVLDFVPVIGISDDEGFDNMIITPVPEPSTFTLLALGFLALLKYVQRKQIAK